jgi:molybdate transport system substrate-binding protein
MTSRPRAQLTVRHVFICADPSGLTVLAADELGGEARCARNDVSARNKRGRQTALTLVMQMHLLLVGIALVACGPARSSVEAPPRELRVWTTRAIATVLAAVGREFELTSGFHLRVISDLPPAFARRAAAGEPFDLLISGSATVDAWIRDGRVVATSRKVLARSGIGVAVRSGAPRLDVGSLAAFRRALLDVESIAYLQVGSGLYIDSLLQRLGLADAIKGKVRRPEGDSVAVLVARGEVELGLVVTTQILTTPGVALAGPLPTEIQSYITFAAAVSSSTNIPAVAARLIAFLQSPAAGRVILAQGMERPPF